MQMWKKIILLIMINTAALFILSNIVTRAEMSPWVAFPNDMHLVDLCWSMVVGLWNGWIFGVFLRKRGVLYAIVPPTIYYGILAAGLRNPVPLIGILEYPMMILLSILMAVVGAGVTQK